MHTIPWPSNGLLPPIATFASRQPTAANEIFKVVHDTCTQSEPVEDSYGEEEGDDNSNKDFQQDHIDSEYSQLISVLEHCDKHAHMPSKSMDVLDGVACASLSLDIVRLARM